MRLESFKRNAPGCLIITLVFLIAAFFLVAEFAKVFVWIKWAFS